MGKTTQGLNQNVLQSMEHADRRSEQSDRQACRCVASHFIVQSQNEGGDL